MDNVLYIQDWGETYDSGSATHHLVMFVVVIVVVVFFFFVFIFIFVFISFLFLCGISLIHFLTPFLSPSSPLPSSP